MGFLKQAIAKLVFVFLSREKKEVIKTLQDYADSFMTFDPDNVLGYFDNPMLYLSDDGPTVFEGRDEIRKYVSGLMKTMTDEGYAKDDLSKFHIKTLAPDVAVTSFHLERLDTKGKSLGKFGAMYTWRKSDDSWKVVIGVLLSHH